MCDACQAREASLFPQAGRFRLQCLRCCVALVASTSPSKVQATGMLAAIERCPEAPPRAAILAGVRDALQRAA